MDDAKKSTVKFAVYPALQIAKLLMTATLVRKQRRFQSHSWYQAKNMGEEVFTKY